MKKETIIFLWDFVVCFEEISRLKRYNRVLCMDKSRAALISEEYNACFDEILLVNLSEFADTLAKIKQLCQFNPICSIISLFEGTVELGGFLRDELRIIGRNYKGCQLVRNKFKMKKCLQNHDVRTAAVSKINSIGDLELLSSYEQTKFVVKPLAGFGTSETYIIDSDNIKYNKKITNLLDKEFQLIAEDYIDVKDEYHCDYIVKNREICFFSVGKYLYPLIQTINAQKPLGTIVFPQKNAHSQLIQKIIGINNESIKALNIINAYCHAEVFVTTDNELYFSEIATRIGGGILIGSCVNNTHGVDVVKMFIDIELGMYNQTPAYTSSYTGFVAFPSYSGVVEKISDEKIFYDIEGLLKVHIYYSIGDVIPDTLDTMTRTGYIVIENKDKKKLKESLLYAYQLFNLVVS